MVGGYGIAASAHSNTATCFGFGKVTSRGRLISDLHGAGHLPLLYLRPGSKHCYRLWKTPEIAKGWCPSLLVPKALIRPLFLGRLNGEVVYSNLGYITGEIAFQLKGAAAKAVVIQTPFLNTLCKAAKKVGIPDDRVILLGGEIDETGWFNHFTSIRNMSEALRYQSRSVVLHRLF